MDAELEAVKTELRKLWNETILTYPNREKRVICAISDKDGVRVTSKRSPEGVWINWSLVLKVYEDLRKRGSVSRTDNYTQGAFIMPLIAKLTTAKILEGISPRTLRYVPEGYPPRLRRDVQPRPKRRLTVLIEKDEDGYFVASVPELRGCHTQGKTLDEAIENIRDAALLCFGLEQNEDDVKLEFIGVHTIEV